MCTWSLTNTDASVSLGEGLYLHPNYIDPLQTTGYLSFKECGKLGSSACGCLSDQACKGSRGFDVSLSACILVYQ